MIYSPKKIVEPVVKANNFIAIKASKSFATMACFWAFLAITLIPLKFPATMPFLQYLSSGILQLVALPLIAVASVLSARASDQMAQEQHAAVMESHEQLSKMQAELAESHADNAKVLAELSESHADNAKVLSELSTSHAELKEIQASVGKWNQSILDQQPSEDEFKQFLAAMEAQAAAQLTNRAAE